MCFLSCTMCIRPPCTMYLLLLEMLTNMETCSHFYQAKFFTESRLLQREVKIILEGKNLIKFTHCIYM